VSARTWTRDEDDLVREWVEKYPTMPTKDMKRELATVLTTRSVKAIEVRICHWRVLTNAGEACYGRATAERAEELRRIAAGLPRKKVTQPVKTVKPGAKPSLWEPLVQSEMAAQTSLTDALAELKAAAAKLVETVALVESQVSGLAELERAIRLVRR